MAKITVVGSSNTDMVVKSSRIPSPGETVLGEEFVMAAGGKGANQAVSAARLGAQVTLVARVGADVFGERALAGFEQEGIDTRYIGVDPEVASGIALIVVDAQGENSIAVAPGANARLSVDDIRRARRAIETADVLLLQLEIPQATVLYAAELARRADVTVILNPAPAPCAPVPSELLACANVVTPNESETGRLAGMWVVDVPTAAAAAHRIIDQGAGAVIVTRGAQGALIVKQDVQQEVPGFGVDAVDTTAAGDAFNGGLAVALATGKDLVAAVRFANACGALATTRMGAQPSLPTAEDVRLLLA